MLVITICLHSFGLEASVTWMFLVHCFFYSKNTAYAVSSWCPESRFFGFLCAPTKSSQFITCRLQCWALYAKGSEI